MQDEPKPEGFQNVKVELDLPKIVAECVKAQTCATCEHLLVEHSLPQLLECLKKQGTGSIWWPRKRKLLKTWRKVKSPE